MSKKLIYLIIALCFLSMGALASIIEVIPVQAWNPMIVGGGGAAAAGGGTVDNCPDATYDFAYTGDNTNGTSYACFDNGASSSTSSKSNSVTVSTDYVVVNATVDYICWTIDETVTTGTVWYSVYTVTASTQEGSAVSLWYADEGIRANMSAGSTTGNGRYNYTHSGDSTVITATGVDYRFGYTWDLSGTDKHKFVSNSTDWADGEEDVEALTAVSSNFNIICIGDDFGATIHREARVHDVYFINGTYQAADPMP